MPLIQLPDYISDDTCLVENPSILRDGTIHELLCVLEWTKAYKITVNPKKSLTSILPPEILSQRSKYFSIIIHF